MAVVVISERAWKFCDSGIRFVPWFFGWNYLIRFPKKVVDLDQKEIKVMSAGGEYPPASSPQKGKYYNSVEVTVVGAAYLNFPREREMLLNEQTGACVCFLKDLNAQQLVEVGAAGGTVYDVPRRDEKGQVVVDVAGHPVVDPTMVVLEEEHPLLEIVRSGVPINRAGLQDWTEEAFISAVRAVAAKKTWKESNENIKGFNRDVEEIFKGDTDGILIKAGFRPSGIRLAIQAVEPPQGVKDAYSGREAATSVAQKEAEETEGRVVEAVAKANGMTRQELEVVLKGDTKRKGQPAIEGGFKEDFANARDVLKRDRAGDGLDDIRVGNVDGTPLEAVTATIASLFGLGKRDGSGRKSKNPSGKVNPQGSGKPDGPGGSKSDKQRAQEFFDKHGNWPFWWDPVAKKVI